MQSFEHYSTIWYFQIFLSFIFGNGLFWHYPQIQCRLQIFTVFSHEKQAQLYCVYILKCSVLPSEVFFLWQGNALYCYLQYCYQCGCSASTLLTSLSLLHYYFLFTHFCAPTHPLTFETETPFQLYMSSLIWTCLQNGCMALVVCLLFPFFSNISPH